MTGLRITGTGSAPGTLRELDRQRILAAVRTLGAASRAELGSATGLSRGTVASIVTDLCREGLLRQDTEHRTGAASRGRPPARLTLAHPDALGLVAVIGHTYARVVVGSGDGTVIANAAQLLPPALTAADALSAVAGLLADVLRSRPQTVQEVRSVVLGLPASMDAQGRPQTSRFRGLDVSRLSGVARLGAPVHVVNDANLAALGEATFGSACHLSDFVYVKMSRSISAGLVLGGRLHEGSRGLAGNIGHLRVRDSGPACRCGNRGCLEMLVGSRRLVDSLRQEHRNPHLGLGDLIRLTQSDDPAALRLVQMAGHETGRVLASVINAFNPDTVVVGGCLSPIGDPLLDALRDSISRYSQPSAVSDLLITRATCPDRPEILGGLALSCGTARAAAR